MKKTLIILVLLFSSSVFAEDISDFQIEGVSFGDSLLDFMSKEEILKQISNPLTLYDYLDPPNKFIEIFFSHGLETYSEISVFIKSRDNNYIIEGVFGEFKNSSIEKCLIEKSKVIEELDTLFGDESKVQSSDYASGDAFFYEHSFILNTSDRAMVQCVEAPEYQEHNSLLVSLTSSILGEWLFIN